MSKYQALWEYVREKECKSLKLTFDEIVVLVYKSGHKKLNDL